VAWWKTKSTASPPGAPLRTRTRTSGPAARSNGRQASAARRARTSASLLPREVDRVLGRDPLARRAVHGPDPQPQRRMPGDDGFHDLAQPARIDRSLRSGGAEGAGQVVDPGLGSEPLGEPEPLLARGERKLARRSGCREDR